MSISSNLTTASGDHQVIPGGVSNALAYARRYNLLRGPERIENSESSVSHAKSKDDLKKAEINHKIKLIKEDLFSKMIINEGWGIDLSLIVHNCLEIATNKPALLKSIGLFKTSCLHDEKVLKCYKHLSQTILNYFGEYIDIAINGTEECETDEEELAEDFVPKEDVLTVIQAVIIPRVIPFYEAICTINPSYYS
ncbi:MAG: hypothetical protein JWO53_1216 [Chlamydiia bacterium]|nr:hypothetical protein [Chlamydiia bacterium]